MERTSRRYTLTMIDPHTHEIPAQRPVMRPRFARSEEVTANQSRFSSKPAKEGGQDSRRRHHGESLALAAKPATSGSNGPRVGLESPSAWPVLDARDRW